MPSFLAKIFKKFKKNKDLPSLSQPEQKVSSSTEELNDSLPTDLIVLSAQLPINATNRFMQSRHGWQQGRAIHELKCRYRSELNVRQHESLRVTTFIVRVLSLGQLAQDDRKELGRLLTVWNSYIQELDSLKKTLDFNTPIPSPPSELPRSF